MNDSIENQEPDACPEKCCALTKGKECLQRHPLPCAFLLVLIGAGIGALAFRREAKPASTFQSIREWLDSTYADAVSKLPEAGKACSKTEKKLLKKARTLGHNLRFW